MWHTQIRYIHNLFQSHNICKANNDKERPKTGKLTEFDFGLLYLEISFGSLYSRQEQELENMHKHSLKLFLKPRDLGRKLSAEILCRNWGLHILKNKRGRELIWPATGTDYTCRENSRFGIRIFPWRRLDQRQYWAQKYSICSFQGQIQQ